MKFHADAFFAQGKTHLVCEDYAVARSARTLDDPHVYAIVSDGCSSSRNTDVGARLLAHSAALQLTDLGSTCPTLVDRERHITDAASSAARDVGVDLRSLDATLVAAYRGTDEDGNPGVRVSLRGGGIIVARTRDDGGFTMVKVDHEHNAPRYLSYDLDPGRLKGYMEKFGDRSLVELYMSGDGWFPKGYDFNGHHDDWFYRADQFDLVMVLSDGACTFQERVSTDTSRTLVDIPLEDVVEQLLRIKVTKGEFLKRRCQRFLHHYCRINEWQHADDFSAAAIHMEAEDV